MGKGLMVSRERGGGQVVLPCRKKSLGGGATMAAFKFQEACHMPEEEHVNVGARK